MTQDEIIRMAREAGISSVWAEASTRQLERFAALVAAHEREKWEPAFSKNKPAPKIENGSIHFEAGLYTPLEVQLAIDILEEREACAKVCDELKATYELDGLNGTKSYHEAAAAIRARGNNK